MRTLQKCCVASLSSGGFVRLPKRTLLFYFTSVIPTASLWTGVCVHVRVKVNSTITPISDKAKASFV